MLDDFAAKHQRRTSSTDSENKRYGFKKGKPENSSLTKLRRTLEYISGKMTDPMWFKITHLRKDVRYHTRLVQEEWEQASTSDSEPAIESKSRHIRDYVHEERSSGGRSRESRKLKKKKPKKNTIVCKIILSLKQLAQTLNATNPHYVVCETERCTHASPRWCTHSMQPRRIVNFYAGVMEVCKIKRRISVPRAVRGVRAWCSSAKRKFLSISPQFEQTL